MSEIKLLPCPFCGAPGDAAEISLDGKLWIECSDAECPISPQILGDNPLDASETWNARAAIDMIIHCPSCGVQHVDEPKPSECKNCGTPKYYHDLAVVPEEYRGVCDVFEPWLNEPHKKHRCGNCNLVFKTAGVPTNGVKSLAEVS